MHDTARKRFMILGLILSLALFAADRVLLAPFMEMRHDLILRRDAIEHELADAQRTLRLEKELQPLHRSMLASTSADPSAVESELLHLMHQWQQRAGVANASFQRVNTIHAHGFTCLTFSVSATGGMAPVASLLYELETAQIPVRLDDVRLAPKHDKGDELQLRLNVSTLCRETGTNSAKPASIASTDSTEGRP